MSDNNPYTIANRIHLAVRLLLAVVRLATYRLVPRKLPLLPDPPGKPISGIVHQLPKTEPW